MTTLPVTINTNVLDLRCSTGCSKPEYWKIARLTFKGMKTLLCNDALNQKLYNLQWNVTFGLHWSVVLKLGHWKKNDIKIFDTMELWHHIKIIKASWTEHTTN